jgi:hypothetical protein
MYERIKFKMVLFTRQYIALNGEVYDLNRTLAMVDGMFEDSRPGDEAAGFLNTIRGELVGLKYSATTDEDLLLPDLLDFTTYVHVSDWFKSYGIQGCYGIEIDEEEDMDQDLPTGVVEVVELTPVCMPVTDDDDEDGDDVIADAVADILLRLRDS